MEIFCTSCVTKKLYDITDNSSHDRNLVTSSSKIKYVEGIFEYLVKIDEEFSKLNYVVSTKIFYMIIAKCISESLLFSEDIS